MLRNAGIAQWLRRPTKRKNITHTTKLKRNCFLRLESLETRSFLAGDTFTLNFEVPEDVQELGVWASINGQLLQPYNSIPTNTFVYYSGGDYVAATENTNLSFQLTVTNGVASLEIPNTPITSAQVVIGVGGAPDFAYNGTGISSPSDQDEHYFGLFEFTLDGSGTGNANNYLDIDLSEVDQVGVPFYVTTDPVPPYPAEDGFGITMQRDTLFNNYQTYVAGKANGIFGETYSQGNLGGTQYRIVAPKDLNLGNGLVQFPTQAVSFSSGGTLTANQEYYWFVTATSANGESTPSDGIGDMTATTGQEATITWEPYVGATGYNIYRATTDDPTAAVLVGQVSGYATNSFVDTGSQINTNAPPTNGYTFSELNAYYNDAIDAFFDAYTATDSFVLYYAGDNVVFVGNTTTYNGYTVLQVSPLGSNDTYHIYKPFFSNNMDPTEFPGLPAAPSWMPHADQSPAQMIFAADGVFNSGDPSAPDAGYQADLGNAISSAFNRGLADNTSMQPSSWASNPALFSAVAGSGGSLAADTYYYVITAETGYDDGTNSYSFGESVVSLERMATTSSNGSVTLTWQATDPPGTSGGPAYGTTAYHVYRSTTPGTGYKRVQTIVNGDSPPATTWTDTGAAEGTETPPLFYAPNSTSNWYAAYWHLNSTNDTTNGVSINGLAYGYPYDDQGGFSTNIQWVSASDGSGVPDTITIHLVGWGEAPNPPHPNPNPHPHPNPSGEPAKIVILEQPVTVKKGKDTTIQFQVLTNNGQPYQGGAEVDIVIDGMEKGSYTVETDETTGIGTLTFKNKKLGLNMLKLSTSDGEVVAYSNVYQVVSDKTPKKAMKAITKADKYLDTKAFKDVLKKLAKRYR